MSITIKPDADDLPDNIEVMPLTQTSRKTTPKFPLVPFADLKVGSEIVCLVKGLIPRVGLTVVWGPPKCGKSFWAFDLAMHVALGWDYRDRRVQGGPVVYCAFEGAEGLKRRAEAFRLRFLPEENEPVPFFLSSSPMDLVNDHPALIASIKVHLIDDPPALVVLDTLNRSLNGSESDDRDMTAYIKAADAIRDAFDCAVMVIHHCGVDASRPRGHTSLAGAVDAQLAVKRDGADNIVVTVERMKDGPEGDTIASALQTVEVGTDGDGEPQTSCVVIPAEASTKASNGSGRLTDRQRLALDALDEVLITHCEPAPANLQLPAGVNAVTLDSWRAEMFSRGVIDPEAGNPREDFRRIRHQLGARKIIAERDGCVWKVVS